jgi:hypothetical protein
MAWLDSLQDPNTLETLKTLGAGVATLIGGGWAVYTWRRPKPGAAKVDAPVTAQTHQAPVAVNGSVALAIDGHGNQINVTPSEHIKEIGETAAVTKSNTEEILSLLNVFESGNVGLKPDLHVRL